MSDNEQLVEPIERPQLQPFAGALEVIVLPAALRLRRSGQLIQPPTGELEALAHQIDSWFTHAALGGLHPAIWVGALKTCIRFYQTAQDAMTIPDDKEEKQALLDSIFSLVCFLECFLSQPTVGQD